MVDGNVPLSIIMSFASTLLAIGTTPLCLFIFYDTRSFDGKNSIQVPYLNIFVTLVFVLFGVAAGLLVRRYDEEIAGLVGKISAAIAVIFLVGALIAGYFSDRDLMSSKLSCWIFAALIQPLGYLGGVIIAYFTGIDWADTMTISIETGVQNVAMALAIVSLSIDESDPKQPDMMRIPILCALLYPFHSLWIILVYRHFPPDIPDALPNEANEALEEPAAPSQEVKMMVVPLTLSQCTTKGAGDASEHACSKGTTLGDTMSCGRLAISLSN